jgi:hypothetical protein
MLQMLKVNNRKIHEWAPFIVYGLPTVQLPKELQVEILHDFAETLNMH